MRIKQSITDTELIEIEIDVIEIEKLIIDKVAAVVAARFPKGRDATTSARCAFQIEYDDESARIAGASIQITRVKRSDGEFLAHVVEP